MERGRERYGRCGYSHHQAHPKARYSFWKVHAMPFLSLVGGLRRVNHLGLTGGREGFALFSKPYMNRFLNMMTIGVKRGVNVCTVIVVGGCWVCELLLEDVEKWALLSGNSMTLRGTEEVGCTGHPLY